MVILSLIAKSDVAEGVLHDGLKDVWWLHPNLLREAPVVCPTRCLRLHIELVDHHFKQVKLLRLEVTEEFFVCLVLGVKVCIH